MGTPIFRWPSALLLLIGLLGSVFGVHSQMVLAQSEVEEAEERVEEAEQTRREQLRIVDEEVEQRDELEQELFVLLELTNQTSQELSLAESDLDRVADRLEYASAQVDGNRSTLTQQAVSAYMEAVGSPSSLIFTSRSGEDAMVIGPVLDQAKKATLDDLGSLSVQQERLADLQLDFSSRRDQVEEKRLVLNEQSRQLEELFAQANTEVADAFRQAQQAEADYRASVDELEQARVREEERRRQEEERKRREEEARRLEEERRRQATEAAQGNASGSNNNGSNSRSGEADYRPLKPGVEQWRGLVATYFPARLVEAALQVMQCESWGNPKAKNPYSGASGLFQFIPSTWAVASVRAGISGSSALDGEDNIIAAAWLVSYYEGRGSYPWSAWVCRPWG